MKIAVSSQGETLDALTSPVFGRCPTFVFVDSATMDFEALPNPAVSQGGGAGIQAAQFVMNQGAGVVLSGNLGPNAFDVLEAASVSGYLLAEGTVRQAVEAFKAGGLQPMGGASVTAHAGLGHGQPITQPQSDREAELAELRETLKDLRKQLTETMDRIEKLKREA